MNIPGCGGPGLAVFLVSSKDSSRIGVFFIVYLHYFRCTEDSYPEYARGRQQTCPKDVQVLQGLPLFHRW